LTEYAEYFENASNAWKAIADRWIESTPSTSDLLIIKYEDLKTSTKFEMEKVVRFLGVEPNRERLTCSVNNPPKRWIHKTPDEIWKRLSDVYDNMAPLSEKLSQYIVHINSALAKRGFATRLDYTRPNYKERVGRSIK